MIHLLYSILVHSHSGLRWIVLGLLLFTIINAFIKKKKGANFGPKDKLLNILTLSAVHLQIVIGLVLYFAEERYKGFSEMGNKILRFYAIEHLSIMVIAAVLITIGHSKIKKIEDHSSKFKKTRNYFAIVLLIILAGIPWPFIIDAAHWF